MTFTFRDRTLHILCALIMLVGVFSFLNNGLSGVAYALKFLAPVLIIFVGAPWGPFSRLPVLLIASWWLWLLAQTASVVVSHQVLFSAMLVASYAVFLVCAQRVAELFAWRSSTLHGTVYITVTLVVLASVALSGDASWTSYAERLRFRSGFINPNFLGQFAAMAIYAGYQWLRELGSRRVTQVLVVSSGTPLVLLLYYSDSRGAAFFLLLAIVMPLVWRLKGILLWASIAAVLVGSLVFGGTNLKIDELTSLRLTRWSDRLTESLVEKNLLFGKGMAEDEAVDNAFVTMFTQAGVTGGVTGLLFAAVSTNIFLQSRIETRAKGLWIAWLAYSMNESMWYSLGNPLSVYVWVIMLTAVTRARWITDESKGDTVMHTNVPELYHHEVSHLEWEDTE